MSRRFLALKAGKIQQVPTTMPNSAVHPVNEIPTQELKSRLLISVYCPCGSISVKSRFVPNSSWDPGELTMLHDA